ncbi:efflux RND transporter permease subunit [Agromyces mangrovi Wang et al. 2018]|uniref:efflux RND transporter permease subunit n=1 Tax=Agromyces mangrovi TaxID=1858653 RepID=UPI002572B209|nr:efflux RND transporter permease subunit [Agromyces mangrovi]BDZ64253.1 multidrug transporter [Agromyces mangrovi]
MHLLAQASLKNRALIALVTIVVAIFGGVSLTLLKQELIPSIAFPQLSVVTTYPGAAPEVVENDVSTPIETSLRGIAGLESTSSTSSTNISVVTATFDYETDLATAEQKMTTAINRISSQLPDDVDPAVVAFSFDDFPVIAIAVSGTDDTSALSDALNRTTVGELNEIDGVREASVIGEIGQRVTIVPDQEELAALGLTTQAITSALQQNGVLLPAGEITEDGISYAVQSGDRLTSVDDVADLPLLGATEQVAAPTPDAGAGQVPGADAGAGTGLEAGAGADAGAGTGLGTSTGTVTVPVSPAPTIGDVASVELVDNPETSISRVNGEPALTLSITKLPAANTVDVSTAVQDAMADLEANIASQFPGAEFTVVFDQSPFIEESIETLAVEGMLGLVMAVLVILVFLLSVRATLVTAISIPTSVLITFIGLWATDYSLNILTLGALTISVGRVVDDSIVVIENIKRHLVEGVEKVPTIVKAVREVAGAITASTVTTIAVFLPVALVGGPTGELFRPFALTVAIALAASLFVSLTIVPVLAYWFLKPAKLTRKDGSASTEALAEETGEDELEHPGRLQKGYLPIIGWTLRHGWLTLVAAVLVLVGTFALYPLMPTNFIGATGQNTFQVTQELPAGTSLEEMDAASTEVEETLRDTEGVEIVLTSIGGGTDIQLGLGGGAGSTITYSITTDEHADQDALQAEVRDELDALGDVGELVLSAQQGGFSSDILIDVTAGNDADLREASEAVVEALDGLPEIVEVTSNLSETRPFIGVVVDREAAADAGYSEFALSSLVASAMQPQAAGSVQIDEDLLTIYVASDDPPATVEELRELPVPTPAGVVELDELAEVDETDGPASITTVQGLRSATVTASPDQADVGAASFAVTAALEEADLPAGTSATVGGVTSDQEEAFTQLGLALLAAILIVYIVMVATFRSLLQPLLLLVSVPFAATGAILLQLAVGIPFGVSSLIGVLMLVGIVVTNAIVLIDLVNQYRDRGYDVKDALLHGASRRLRPILMTALATIFALIPMASGITGTGGFISQPLAIVVIGGLLSSTVLTLIVLPVLYFLVEGGREKRRAKRELKRAQKRADEEAAAAAAASGSPAE